MTCPYCELARADGDTGCGVHRRQPGLWPAPAVCRIAGVTYRRLDYWTRTGAVACHTPARGSGTHRGYSAEQVADVALLADLLRLGFRLDAVRPLDYEQRVRLRDAVAAALDHDRQEAAS